MINISTRRVPNAPYVQLVDETGIRDPSSYHYPNIQCYAAEGRVFVINRSISGDAFSLRMTENAEHDYTAFEMTLFGDVLLLPMVYFTL